MGLGDMMYKLGIRYGSEEGQEFAAQIMEFVRYHAMRTSVELAATRGPFLAFEGSIYDPQLASGGILAAPQPLQPSPRRQRPALDWRDRGRHRGARHPQRRPDHRRPHGHHCHRGRLRGLRLRAGLCPGLHSPLQGRRTRTCELHYTSPLFEQALDCQPGWTRRRRSASNSTRQPSAPARHRGPAGGHLRHTFVVSSDITRRRARAHAGRDPGVRRQQHLQDLQLP
jgi:ribonucleoside-diphosphate reductase alpha chain